MKVSIPGERLSKPWHRKLADLETCEVPADAESLYEATCYAAGNNALAIRSKKRYDQRQGRNVNLSHTTE